MTTVVWDGRTIAVDAMTTHVIGGSEAIGYQSIKLRRLARPIPAGSAGCENVLISVVTGTGDTVQMHRWVTLLNELAGKEQTLHDLCRLATRMGGKYASMFFVGRDTKKNTPVCLTYNCGILTRVTTTQALGNASRIFHELVANNKDSGLTAAELVYCGIRLDPKSSGFQVNSYDPTTDLVETIDTWSEERVAKVYEAVKTQVLSMIEPLKQPAIPGFLHLTDGALEDVQWFKKRSAN